MLLAVMVTTGHSWTCMINAVEDAAEHEKSDCAG